MSNTVATPARSLEQRFDALKRANRVRTYRADLKRDLKRGERAPASLLLARPPRELETMRVRELLLAVPKVGRVKADTMLRRAKVSPSKTLGGLSERQRRELCALLPRRRR